MCLEPMEWVSCVCRGYGVGVMCLEPVEWVSCVCRGYGVGGMCLEPVEWVVCVWSLWSGWCVFGARGVGQNTACLCRVLTEIQSACK